jgi:diaminohydroxyphosphoribosylaminopyrimidine deaminase/5-amino-6-(5-phosphoribosylamino)uracil reductase
MTHQAFMDRALQLAQQGQGRAEPNPLVGAVIVRDNQIVATGYHQHFGGPHAEINALNHCRAQNIDPAGLTMYVTLEPCSHHGKTPPCAQALIDARLKNLYVAMTDPFPQVAGQGLALLRNAGINVHLGLAEPAARELNAPYLKRLDTNLPFVIAKWAQTLDGKIASSTGQSKWISNTLSRSFVHQLRARVDAIIVGINTVLADNPALTARDVPIKRLARRVVVDRDLRIPFDCQLLNPPDPPLTIAAAQPASPEQQQKFHQLQQRDNVELFILPRLPDNKLDLRPLLHHLAQNHLATNVLLEGGSSLLGSFLHQQLIDQLLVFIAPRILGDPHALSAITNLPQPNITDAQPLNLRSIQRFNDDVLLDLRTTASPSPD